MYTYNTHFHLHNWDEPWQAHAEHSYCMFGSIFAIQYHGTLANLTIARWNNKQETDTFVERVKKKCFEEEAFKDRKQERRPVQ